MHINYNAYFSNCLFLPTCVIGCVKGVVSVSHIRPLATQLTTSNQTIISYELGGLWDDDVLYPEAKGVSLCVQSSRTEKHNASMITKATALIYLMTLRSSTVAMFDCSFSTSQSIQCYRRSFVSGLTVSLTSVAFISLCLASGW
jgi:hypothetical protein